MAYYYWGAVSDCFVETMMKWTSSLLSVICAFAGYYVLVVYS